LTIQGSVLKVYEKESTSLFYGVMNLVLEQPVWELDRSVLAYTGYFTQVLSDAGCDYA
jgi:hypothetical protein